MSSLPSGRQGVGPVSAGERVVVAATGSTSLSCGLQVDSVLTRQGSSKGESRDVAGLDEDLADEAAGPALLRERCPELGWREDAGLDEQFAHRVPGVRGLSILLLSAKLG